MKNKYILEVLEQKASDRPVMKEFLEAVFDYEDLGKLQFKSFYNKQINEALKKGGAFENGQD